MDPFTLILACVIFAKMIAEDTYSGVTGKPNPRLERRKARQKSRSNNRIWGALVGYLSGVAEDAVAQAEKKRARKRQLEDEEWEVEQERRRQRQADDLNNAIPGEMVEPEEWIDPRDDPTKPDVWDVNTPDPINPTCPHGADVDNENCGWSTCPIHGHRDEPEPDQTHNPYSQHHNRGGAPTMNGTDAGQFLDASIQYCKEVAAAAAEQGVAGNEGFVHGLAANQCGPNTIAAVQHAQEASATAAAAWEGAAAALEDANKAVQEAYNSSGGEAGNKGFQTGGQ